MKYSVWALRLILLFALAVCGAVLGEYLFTGSLCDFRSGCGSVLTSAYAHPLGVPLPVVGLVGFGLLFVLSLFPGRGAFRLVGPLALAGGLAGLALILVQVLVLGKTCLLCLMVDSSALVLAALVLVGGRWFLPFPWKGSRGSAVESAALLPAPPLQWSGAGEEGIELREDLASHPQPLGSGDEGSGTGTGGRPAAWPPPSRRLVTWLARAAWLAAAVVAMLLPPLVAWAWSEPPVPEQVKALWVEGKITVVELSDFECPACRSAEPNMRAFREKMGDKIHFVRVTAPLPKHEHARDAARAFLAAEAQGRGEDMAAALFGIADHPPGECRKMAESLGLNLAEYDRVVSDPETDARIDATNAWAAATRMGVPLVWVGDQLVRGGLNPLTLQVAYRKALLSEAARQR